MRRISLVVFFAVLLIYVSGCSRPEKMTETQKKYTFATEKEKESYAAGFRSGIQLYGMVKNNDIDFDIALQGIKDAVNEQPQLPKQDMTKIYSEFKNKLMKRQEERQKEGALNNKLAGDKFLKENTGKEGIVTLPSGLQYKVLKEGAGPSPNITDIVILHYRGFLIDGREFIDTRKHEGGQQVKLPVARSLPFWKEALPLMRVGAMYRFFVPPNLAYQEYGYPPLVEPNAVLVYETVLEGIVK
jgi:FKBP-type peptidyl-prolyl cis-trans isomerase